MKDSLNVALIQADLVWENPIENRRNFEVKIEGLPEETDLVVLPEMFTTGFTMHPELVAETMKGKTVNWMLDLAKKHDLAITGSLIIKAKDATFRNRMLFIKSNGDITFYDKRHSFSLAGENKKYTSGVDKVIVDFKGFKICLQICYDLRFPVFSRNVENYDVLIYVANWPKTRITAWDTLLKARAIENMCFTIGVNRVGLDANNYEYSGHSASYNVLGAIITETKAFNEDIQMVSLNKIELVNLRNKLGFLNDRDSFSLLD